MRPQEAVVIVARRFLRAGLQMAIDFAPPEESKNTRKYLEQAIKQVTADRVVLDDFEPERQASIMLEPHGRLFLRLIGDRWYVSNFPDGGL